MLYAGSDPSGSNHNEELMFSPHGVEEKTLIIFYIGFQAHKGAIY